MKRFFFRAAVSSGIHHLWRFRHRSELLILCYHGVRSSSSPDDIWHLVSARDLEEQLTHLVRFYDVLDLDSALDLLPTRPPSARPLAAVTFDDGYLNNRTEALPILRRLGIPATVFLATGLIGTERMLWTIDVQDIFQNATVRIVDLSFLGLNSVALGDPADRRRLASLCIDRLKAMPQSEKQAHIWTLRDQMKPRPGSDSRMALMDWADVSDMEASGLVRFGAHTVNHEIVSQLGDRELRREILESVATIAGNVSNPSRTFAYPNGRLQDFDGRAEEVLREAGISHALTTIEGLNTWDENPYALRRVVIGNGTSFSEFRLRVSGFLCGTRCILFKKGCGTVPA